MSITESVSTKMILSNENQSYKDSNDFCLKKYLCMSNFGICWWPGIMYIHKIGQFPRSNVQLWPKNLTNFDPHKLV